jgi:predicted RNase H-like HicB family nuclease
MIFVIMPSSKGVTMKKVFTAFVEYDEESKFYVGTIPNVPGAHTQAETLDELQRNLQEILELCLEENSNPGETFGHSLAQVGDLAPAYP